MRRSILLLLVACCLAGSAFAGDNASGYTLYLVRHAEKQSDGTRDPALTDAGTQRATQLAEWLKDKGIADVYSSDYQRTRDTAGPLASALGVELSIYDPGKLQIIGAQLKENHSNAFVVGHSNTTPDLARLLCDCTIADMDESEYDRLIEIRIEGENTQVRIHQQGKLFRP